MFVHWLAKIKYKCDFTCKSINVPVRAVKKCGGIGGLSPLIQTVGTVECDWSDSRPDCFTVGGNGAPRLTQRALYVVCIFWRKHMLIYISTLLYIIQSTQHNSQSYRYMFRLNKSSSGVSKNHKTNHNMPVHIWDPRWLTMCVGIRI
jgi:hypothetical protein